MFEAIRVEDGILGTWSEFCSCGKERGLEIFWYWKYEASNDMY